MHIFERFAHFSYKSTDIWKKKSGGVIPTGSVPNALYAPESPIPERVCTLPQPNVIDILKSFQQNISQNLSSINEKLKAIDERKTCIEERQKYFEEASSLTSTSAPVSSPLPHGKRKRKHQLHCRYSYNNFAEFNETIS